MGSTVDEHRVDGLDLLFIFLPGPDRIIALFESLAKLGPASVIRNPEPSSVSGPFDPSEACDRSESEPILTCLSIRSASDVVEPADRIESACG